MIKCKRLQHRPDSVCSWLVSICASMCQVLNLGFSVSYGVFLPELLKQFSEDRHKTVWVGSLAIALTFFLGPLGSVLCERIGCRFTVITGCLICVLSLLSTSYSSSLQWMFVTYSFLYGLGASLMFSSCFLITAKNFRRWQSLAVGIVSVGTSIGILIMGPLLQHLIDMVGWRVTYRIISVPLFVMACVCGATFGDPIQDPSKTTTPNCSENQGNLKIHPLNTLSGTMETVIVNLDHVDDLENKAIHNRGGKSSEERKGDFSNCHYRKAIESSNEIKSLNVVAASSSEDKNSTGSGNTVTGKLRKLVDFSVFKVPSYTVVIISLSLMNFGHYIPQMHLVKYCLDLGISADSASRLFIFIGLSSSVARVVTGRLCDVTWVNPILINQFGDLLIGFAAILLPIIRSYTGIVAFAVIYGFGDGILTTTMNILLMFTVDEKRRAAAMGLGNSLLAVGMAAGPPMAGLLADVFDCYTWSFFMAGIVTQLAGLVPLVLFCLGKKKGFDLKKNIIGDESLAVYRQHNI